MSAPTQDAEKVRQLRSHLESILNVAQEATPPVLSSAAALLDGLFEHPAWRSSVVMDSKLKKHWHVYMIFHSLLAFKTAQQFCLATLLVIASSNQHDRVARFVE